MPIHTQPLNRPNIKPATAPNHYALTGNIGSGKTTVAGQFERLGIPVYYADRAAKRLMHEDESLRQALTRRFGPETYLSDGALNRTHLAKSFAEPAALNDLNALVHPAVHRDAHRWRAEQSGAAPFTLYEAAIVLELGRVDDFAGVVVVHAPERERRRRVMLRDGVTGRQFADRAARQWSDDRKLAAADYVIHNSGGELILPRVLRVYQLLTEADQAT